jgi:ferredoxin-NADP reductase
MAEYRMTLVDRQRIARDTMAFWFEADGASFEFRAGQHADFVFTRPCMGSESDNSRTFSLASSPRDKEPVMIAMRMRKTDFKSALESAVRGTKFVVSRPRGSFTLHRDITRPAVFLAGGIGITPIRSILQQAAQEHLPHKLYLFYSNREAEDAAFLDEFESMTAQNPNFTLVPTITGYRTLAWPYEKGHINREMLKRYLLGLKGPVYYIAGPSGMVAAMTELLHSLGVSDDDIKTEEFGDYKPYPDSAQSDQGTSNDRSDSAL